MRYGLPLMILNSHNVNINPMDTPSTSTLLKESYTFSILDHIQRILNNPSIYPKLYFGPGIETLERFELWHGQIWKESPIFGETSYQIGNGIVVFNLHFLFYNFLIYIYNIIYFLVLYQAGDFILYQIQRGTIIDQQLGQINSIVKLKEDSKEKLLYIQKIIYYKDLPGNLRSSNRLNKSKKYTVWLTEERETIYNNDVIGHINIWLEDLPEPENYDYQIGEILYTYNNQTKIRKIQQRHRLSCKSNIQKPSNIRHLKFFIDLYYDDFGAFGKAYHKLGGLYIQFGNMPLSMRQCLKNHFLVGLVPFGAKFTDFIKPFIEQMQKLQNGIIMTNCNGEKVFVSGGLGMCTADLPQGNDMAGIRRHNANRGCRLCEVTQEKLTLVKR